MIEVIVCGITEVDISGGTVDGAEAIVALKVKIILPPGDGVEIGAGGVKGIPIRGILYLGGALVLFVSAAALDLVDVSVSQSVFIEEASIGMLDGLIESPKITVVLVGGRFHRVIDDPEVDVMSVGAGDACQLIESVRNHLVDTCDASLG